MKKLTCIIGLTSVLAVAAFSVIGVPTSNPVALTPPALTPPAFAVKYDTTPDITYERRPWLNSARGLRPTDPASKS